MLEAALRGIGQEFVPNNDGEIIFESTHSVFSVQAHVKIGDRTFQVKVTQTS